MTTPPDKIDLFKEHRAEYNATATPALIETSRAQYLAIEGQGPAGGPAFEACIGALYAMAFTVKMTRKSEGLGDYVICKLETLFYGADSDSDLGDVTDEDWRWTMLIRTPACVTQADLDKATTALLDKGKCQEVKDVSLRKLSEGPCVQMLHVGPYDKVGDTVTVMQAFATEQGLSFAGKHHEIFISDPRRVAPEKLKTIVRQPVREDSP